MTKAHEFNQNLAFTNEETHKALVSHFNQIQDIVKNKKFEWEDEELTETYNITYDFNEWLKEKERFIKEYINDSVFPEHCSDLQDTLNNLVEYIDQLKDYVDAFLLGPTGMYNGKAIEAKTVKSHTKEFNEVVEFVKELKENNKMVFLYEITENKVRPNDIEIDGVTYPQDLSTFYKVRYGVL